MTIHRLLQTCLIVSLVGLFVLLNVPTVLAAAPAAALQTAGGVKAPLVDGPNGTVQAWRLNVRSGPGTGYPILTTAAYHEVLGLTGRAADNSWLLIRRNSGEEGWVSAYYMAVSAAHLSAVPIVDGSEPPQVPPSGEITGHVTAYRLNVRSGPGVDNPVTSQLREGQLVTLIGRDVNSAWLQIRIAGQPQSWVSARYIGGTFMPEALPITGGAVPNPSPTASGTVTAVKLNVRSGPSLAYGIMGWAYRNQSVDILGRNSASTWLKITLAPGFDGWVAASYIATNSPIAGLPVLD